METDPESEDTEKYVSPQSSLENQAPLVEDLESCTYCDFDTESVSNLNKHIEIVHGIVKLSADKSKSEERKQCDAATELEEENKAIQN